MSKSNFSAFNSRSFEQLTDSVLKAMKFTASINAEWRKTTEKELMEDEKEDFISHLDNVHSAMTLLLAAMENAAAVISPASDQPQGYFDPARLLENAPLTDPLRLSFPPKLSSSNPDQKNENTKLEDDQCLSLNSKSMSQTNSINSDVKNLLNEVVERVVQAEPFDVDGNVNREMLKMKGDNEQKVQLCQTHFLFFFAAMKDIDDGLRRAENALFYPVMQEFYAFCGTKTLTEYASFKSSNARKFLRAQQNTPNIDEDCFIVLCLLEMMMEDEEFGNLARELVIFTHYHKKRGRDVIDEWLQHINTWQVAHWMCKLHLYLEFHEVRIDGLKAMEEDLWKYVWKHDFKKVRDLEFFEQRWREMSTTKATSGKSLMKQWFYELLKAVTETRKCDILDADFDFISTRAPELMEKVEDEVVFNMFGVKNGRLDF